jgi:flagellar L-ring protein FlgH
VTRRPRHGKRSRSRGPLLAAAPRARASPSPLLLLIARVPQPALSAAERFRAHAIPAPRPTVPDSPSRAARALDADLELAANSSNASSALVNRGPVKPAGRSRLQRASSVELLGLLAVLPLLACEPAHVAAYVPKRRVYEMAPSTPAVATQASPGSLYGAAAAPMALFTDMRAFRESDVVVVRVEEIADATRRADTGLRRTSELGADVSAFLSAVGSATPTPGGGPQGGLGFNSTSRANFDSQGSTGRSERFTANVPALVRKVLPNGNLFIEGHRVVLVNAEEHHFYISGVVRPIDIDQTNTVKSSVIADAEVEFTGRGVVSDAQRPGILSRFFSWIWPF